MTQHKYMYKHKKKLSFSWNFSSPAIFMLLPLMAPYANHAHKNQFANAFIYM